VWKKARFGDGDPGEARIHAECGARLLVETAEEIAMGDDLYSLTEEEIRLVEEA
jgi:hypothetical protein